VSTDIHLVSHHTKKLAEKKPGARSGFYRWWALRPLEDLTPLVIIKDET
jgi:hypothetical protein